MTDMALGFGFILAGLALGFSVMLRGQAQSRQVAMLHTQFLALLNTDDAEKPRKCS